MIGVRIVLKSPFKLFEEFPLCYLLKKLRNSGGMHHDTKHQSEKCTEQMGIVVDVVICFPTLEIGVDQVQGTQYKTWYTDGKVEVNLVKGFENYESENNRGHAPRRTQRVIAGIASVFKIGWPIRYANSNQV